MVRSRPSATARGDDTGASTSNNAESVRVIGPKRAEVSVSNIAVLAYAAAASVLFGGIIWYAVGRQPEPVAVAPAPATAPAQTVPLVDDFADVG